MSSLVYRLAQKPSTVGAEVTLFCLSVAFLDCSGKEVVIDLVHGVFLVKSCVASCVAVT